MNFDQFIKKLSDKDKENYENYSKIRGPQQYRIIFETLKKANGDVTYSDVNAFVRYDKALKDALYVFLGTLEEYIKTYIFANFDFEDASLVEKKLKNKPYKNYSKDYQLKEINNSNNEITDLYKVFKLSFGDIIKLLEDNKCPFDTEKLKKVKILRDKVMHHLPVLFNIDFISNVEETRDEIEIMKELLPDDYKDKFIEVLKDKTKNTKNNISQDYYKFLLFEEE